MQRRYVTQSTPPRQVSTPSVQEWGCVRPKTVNCTKFWNIIAPQERILCATLTKLSGFMGGSMSIEVSNLAGFAEGVQVLWEFNVGGVFFPKFSASPNGETMRPIWKRFRVAKMPSMVRLGLARRRGPKRSMLLSVTLLNGKVCEREMATIKPFELGNDFGTVG